MHTLALDVQIKNLKNKQKRKKFVIFYYYKNKRNDKLKKLFSPFK